ncbi:hypothetical protein ABPG72_022123 [Tetrahymena utriculariae]
MKQIKLVMELPLGLEQILIGQLYMDYMIDYDLLRSNKETIVYPNQKPNEKVYILGESLPNLYREIIGNYGIQIISNKMYNVANYSASIQCYQFDLFQCNIDSTTAQGPVSNLQIDPNIRYIDILDEKIDYFKGFEDDIKISFQQNFNIESTTNWQKNSKKITTITKNIQYKISYDPASSQLQECLEETIRKFYIYYYKSMLIIFKRWIQMDSKEIEQKMAQVKNMVAKYDYSQQLYPYKISNFQDLQKQTNYTRVAKRSQRLFKENSVTSEQSDLVKNRFQNRLTSNLTEKTNLQNLSMNTTINPNQNQNNNLLNTSYQQQQLNGSFQQNQNANNNTMPQTPKLTPFAVNTNSDSSSEVIIKRNIIRKKAGVIFKKGDGPIDFDWNERYLVLDCENLLYFKTQFDKTPRGYIHLKDCFVSSIFSVENEREHAFYVESLSPQKKYYFSGLNKEETEQWRQEILNAAKMDQKQEIKQSINEQVKPYLNEKKVDKKITNLNSRIPRIMKYQEFKQQDYPSDLNSVRLVLHEVENEISEKQLKEHNKTWHFDKYRNGVKLFESVRKVQKPSIIVPVIFYAVLMILLQGLFTEDIDRYCRLNFQLSLIKNKAIINSILTFFITFRLFMKKQKSSKVFHPENEILAQIFINDYADNIFGYLKNQGFRKQIDFNIQSYDKMPTSSKIIKKLSSNLMFDSKPKGKNTINTYDIACSQSIYRFILNEFKTQYYLVTDSEGKGFRMIEVILILPKQDGRSELRYYCGMTSSKLRNIEKSVLRKRSQQLIAIRDLIQENSLSNSQITSDSNGQQLRGMDCSFQIMGEMDNSLDVKKVERNLDVQLSANKQINISQQQSSSQLSLSQQKKTITKYKLLWYTQNQIYSDKIKNDFSDQIKIVQLLINNQVPNSVKRIPIEDRKLGYKKVSEGGIGCYNKEEIKSQEGLIMELIKRVGKRLIEGKDVVSVSLPVRIFEPRSTIERICDNWAFMPIYLRLASNTQDVIERFRLTIAFAIAGLYNVCKQLKPFNPILGETFQGFWADGTKIEIEHTSHHPPISHFYVQDSQKRYRFHGHYEYKAKLNSANSVQGSQEGPNHVIFYDGQQIIYRFPPCKITGLLYGTRVLEFYETMTFVDQKNDLECIISFAEGASFFSRAEFPTDYFTGTINRISDKTQIINNVKGSWLEYLEFDAKRYWDIQLITPANLLSTQDPLPSDCRFREDLVYLAKKDLDQSQDWKNKLEVIQRNDRKLRAEHHGPSKNH